MPFCAALAALAALEAGLILFAGPDAGLPAPAAASSPAYTPTAMSYGGWAAGYLADAPAGQAFTAIATTFRLPAAGPVPQTAGGAATTNGWVSLWAGIGIEAHGGSLMQAGISMHAGPGGWDLAAPWWINEPRTPTAPHALGFGARPGDLIQVLVQETDAADSVWTFTISDLTSGAHDEGICYRCIADGSTAAWVEEDPLSGSEPAQFADPGLLDFVSASAALGGGTLQPLGQAPDWRPLIRTVGALCTYAPLPGQLPTASAAATNPGHQGAAQGPLLPAPGAGGGFLLGELQSA